MTALAEQAIADAKSTIEKLDATLRESEAVMAQRRQGLEQSGLKRETVDGLAKTLDPKHQEAIAQAKQAVLDEIERDLPSTAARKPRLKPTRQMV